MSEQKYKKRGRPAQKDKEIEMIPLEQHNQIILDMERAIEESSKKIMELTGINEEYLKRQSVKSKFEPLTKLDFWKALRSKGLQPPDFGWYDGFADIDFEYNGNVLKFTARNGQSYSSTIKEIREFRL